LSFGWTDRNKIPRLRCEQLLIMLWEFAASLCSLLFYEVAEKA
jgi:hypothetical protein